MIMCFLKHVRDNFLLNKQQNMIKKFIDEKKKNANIDDE